MALLCNYLLFHPNILSHSTKYINIRLEHDIFYFKLCVTLLIIITQHFPVSQTKYLIPKGFILGLEWDYNILVE